ncbi:MAG: hypothetical protein KY410_02340 [Proteobacteria bacterium]|nr:hypothetical protein [Pseudomonadota bacterium]
MRHALPIAIISGMICGCASTASQLEDSERTPTCEAGHECSTKWYAAEKWITEQAHRLIVHKTDNVMRTAANWSRSPEAAIYVRRVRTAPGEYRIEARMKCGNLAGCDPDPAEALRRFNRYVNQSWIELPKKDSKE